MSDVVCGMMHNVHLSITMHSVHFDLLKSEDWPCLNVAQSMVLQTTTNYSARRGQVSV